jgi:hypothetical protein
MGLQGIYSDRTDLLLHLEPEELGETPALTRLGSKLHLLLPTSKDLRQSE